MFIDSEEAITSEQNCILVKKCSGRAELSSTAVRSLPSGSNCTVPAVFCLWFPSLDNKKVRNKMLIYLQTKTKGKEEEGCTTNWTPAGVV